MRLVAVLGGDRYGKQVRATTITLKGSQHQRPPGETCGRAPQTPAVRLIWLVVGSGALLSLIGVNAKLRLTLVRMVTSTHTRLAAYGSAITGLSGEHSPHGAHRPAC